MLTIKSLAITNIEIGTTNNSIMVQGGDILNGDAESQLAQLIQPFGYYGTPSKSVASTSAAEGTFLVDVGGRDICIGGRDIRVQNVVMDYGECLIQASGVDTTGQNKIYLKNDGSINMLTQIGNKPGAGGLGIVIDPLDAIHILTNGGCFTTLDGGGGTAAFGNSNGAITIDKQGDTMVNTSGTIMLSSQSVILGSGSAQAPLAWIGPLMKAMTQLNVWLTTVVASASAITGLTTPASPGAPCTVPDLVALKVALSGATAVISTLAPYVAGTGVATSSTVAS